MSGNRQTQCTYSTVAAWRRSWQAALALLRTPVAFPRVGGTGLCRVARIRQIPYRAPKNVLVSPGPDNHCRSDLGKSIRSYVIENRPSTSLSGQIRDSASPVS